MNITTDAGNGGPWEWRPDTAYSALQRGCECTFYIFEQCNFSVLGHFIASYLDDARDRFCLELRQEDAKPASFCKPRCKHTPTPFTHLHNIAIFFLTEMIFL